MNNRKTFGALLFAFLLLGAIYANLHFVSAAYGPQKGDYFNYSETITVNNGQGSYSGYNDQTQTTGDEHMNAVNGTIVSASYSYSYNYSSNQGASTSSSSSGTYTWTSNNYTYVNGTDNEVGYTKPIRVWFAMNPSLPLGATFYVLNTQFTVLQKNYSFLLPSQNKYVQTIQAEGTGQYQRNDSYGVFNASFTWYEYFDPSTGYVVGYNYVEQDNGKYQGQVGSFAYTDDLYVTSTSYVLAAASAPPNSSTTTANNAANLFGLAPYLGIIIGLVVFLFIVAIAAYAATRRRRKGDSLPKHPYPPYTPPPSPQSSSTPWGSKVDLGSQPSQQVVVRDVAKVNCKYCGTLIPTTADHCPYCGAPRQ